MYKCKYYKIQELVSPIVYNQWGNRAWMFFDEDVLRELDYIRETYGKGIIINNYHIGGNLKQCGLRSNMDELVKSKTTLYLSAHCLAKGFDMHSADGNNKALWQHIYNLILTKKLKKFRRLENIKATPTWAHADCFQSDSIVFC